MKQLWLVNNGSNRLVLLFGGWSSGPEWYAGIRPEGWDVLLCYDFDDYKFDMAILDGYDTVFLYAWSLGVHAAAMALQGCNITSAFAVNGTESPCHDSLGIPEDIFRGTRENLTQANLIRFQRRMFAGRKEYEEAAASLPESPDIEALRSQLLKVEETGTAPAAGFWTRAYISQDDRIFPSAAQERAWSGHPSGCELCVRPGHHAADIAALVRNTIPNPRIVGRKFHKSLDTYDANAAAQHAIAGHLASLALHAGVKPGASLLEIGQGSGMSTVIFDDTLKPAHIDCVDLYQTPAPQIAAKADYYVGDGEQWLGTRTEKWDCIISASAIQWFADVRTFFRRASEHLKENGVLACSTFAPGNLSEFDALRPSPMLYRTQEEIDAWLQEIFSCVETSAAEIRVTFNTPREALMHLRLTGVGGFSSQSLGLPELTAAIPRDSRGRYFLTYRPLYIIARK